MKVELVHKTYGRVMADADDLATDHPMIRVRLINGRDMFDHCDNYITVGKAALNDTGGYKPKHRDRSLAEMYLPLAMSIAASMRKGDDEYEELVGIASEALVKASQAYDTKSVVNFAVFARRSIENAIKDHWRKTARVSYQTGDWSWDDMMGTDEVTTNKAFTDKLQLAVDDLRPRLATIIKKMYLTDHPVTAKELAYEWNISQQRIDQLKQEAIGLLRVTMKINSELPL